MRYSIVMKKPSIPVARMRPTAPPLFPDSVLVDEEPTRKMSSSEIDEALTAAFGVRRSLVRASR